MKATSPWWVRAGGRVARDEAPWVGDAEAAPSCPFPQPGPGLSPGGCGSQGVFPVLELGGKLATNAKGSNVGNGF